MEKIVNIIGWVMLVVSSVILIITGVGVSDISKVVTLAGGAVAAIVALVKPLIGLFKGIKKKE